MNSIVEALEHTPWWVFLIFLFVVSRGVLALQTRTVEIARLAIIPVIFAVWGAYSLFHLFGPNPQAIGIFAVALLVGGGVGLMMSSRGAMRADQARGVVELPGSPVTLILVLIIFVARYGLGYWDAVEPGARDSFGFLALDAIVSGLVIGIFVGRFAGVWRRYKRAPPLPPPDAP
jgi:hypothetical protein